MVKIAIIADITSASSRMNGVLNHLKARLEEDNLEVFSVNAREFPPEDLVYSKFDSPFVISSNNKVEEAGGVIIATPVYKASYTGVLKAYLDLLPQKALVGKTILPVAIGGTIAHVLSIDYALKPVLSALGATHLLQGVYVLDTQVKRDEHGRFDLSEEITDTLNIAIRQFAQALH